MKARKLSICSHLGLVVAAGALLGDLPPKHHLPELLRRLQGERGTVRDQRRSNASGWRNREKENRRAGSPG